MTSSGNGNRETRRPHVLVIEPEPLVRDFIQATLQEIGIAVLPASNATEARQCLRRFPVELAIVAVMLRRIPGDELAREIARRGIPVVLMSGHEEGLRRAQASGFPVLKKPFRAKELLRQVILRLGPWKPDPP
jgi:two-component system response regulator MprA